MLYTPMFRDSEGERTLSPAEYAAQWGCDPCYDRSPRLPGDGYFFYNFGSEKHTFEWLNSFIGAIDRTIADVKAHPDVHDGEDLEDLETLKAYVEVLLQDTRQ